ncbi:hypothetical protein [Rhodococcus sp. HNM0569]|uniref:hypothetical protein n=1 Tax=Rhodococcus sp. HNM0569 TaxID=2716340 RepID=UPI00146C82FD|nr:hypothetical protein [Rhodococcus sp. HNM0569]NLU84036.1 hypothetical protein [Rhodococcus sp. HNM0569]
MSTTVALVILGISTAAAVIHIWSVPLDRPFARYLPWRRRAPESPVAQVAESMDVGELEATIRSLAIRESELRGAGDVEGARALGRDRFACIAQLRTRCAADLASSGRD